MLAAAAQDEPKPSVEEVPASSQAAQPVAPPPVGAAKAEAKSTPAIQVEPPSAQPTPPILTPPPDLLVIEQPIRLELVRVPAGEFLMGSDPAKDKYAEDREQPQHRLFLPEFYIGKYPVTNEQYAVFLQQTTGRTPDDWDGCKVPVGKERHPVVNVMWHDAWAFCQWLSKATGMALRLPSKAEWEKAARGVDGRFYPWGDQAPSAGLCNFKMNVGATTPVNRYVKGASPYGR